MVVDDLQTARGEYISRGLASVAALVAAVLLIALVFMVAVSTRDRDAALARERDSYDMLVVIRGLDSAMARSEAALGRFVISGEKTTGALYYDEWRLAGRQLKRLARLAARDPEQLALVRELETAYDERGRELADPATRATYRQGWQALSRFNEAGKAASIPHINDILDRLQARERRRLGEMSAIAETYTQRSNFLSALLSGLGVILVFGASGLGWLTVQAYAAQRRARARADEEADRATELEIAVAARTRELSDANDRLRQEAETRAAAEAQLRQVQKMEAVGQLTGGIAHDFNNMLAVVVGGLDLARRRLQHETDEVGRHIENAMEGANRAAALTKRLLAFARAEPLLPEGVSPSRLITGMSDLIDRTLGERIAITVSAPAETWPVWCDPNQLENAILNMAVNARDAMEGEGRLSIVTENVTLAADDVGEAPAGDYVRIAVTDTGCGMTPEVKDRVFEPFFTTKPVGKGTGLGLSQIFGFVRQSEGEIEIDTAPGRGTTVALYLPRHRAALASDAAPVPVNDRHADVPIEGGIILVVEDDARVRGSTVDALEELGFEPVPSASGEEALAILAERSDIDLVISDVIMPGMTGPQLLAEIEPRWPHLRLLFVTGYVGEAGDAEQFRGHDVLRKPFTLASLSAAVTHALQPRAIDRAA